MQGLIFLVVCAIATAAEGLIAPFVTPCHANDLACLKTSAQKAVPILAAGIPPLGLQPMDPMTMNLVKADQAGLKMEFRNTVVKGLRNCVVLGLKRQENKHLIDLKCSVVLIGNYTIGGRLLILPVEGDGRYKISITDIVVKVQYDVNDRQADGVTYWSLVNWKYSYDVKTGAVFVFENLFNGNRQLGDPVLKFANDNWKEIFEEVAPPIVRAIVSKIVREVSKFFDKVPLKELALD